MTNKPIVWLFDEGIHATLLNLGAYYSLVSYRDGGIDYEVLVDNDEIDFMEEDDV